MTSSKKILILKETLSVPTNGAEINFYKLYQTLTKDGHDVSYYCFDPITNEENVVSYFSKSGYTIDENTPHRLKYRIADVPITVNREINFLRHNLNDIHEYVEKLKQHVIDLNPNVILCYQTDYIIIQLALELNIPFVSFLHDVFYLHKKDIRANPFGSLIESQILKTKYFAASSDFLKNDFYSEWGILPKTLYGLFDKPSNVIRQKIKNKKMGMVNTASYKGFGLFSLMALAYPQHNFITALTAQPTLEQEKAHSQLQAGIPNLKIVGPFLTVDDFYKQTGILFVPSTIPEAFGRVAVEAGLHGIPVLATNLGGLPEALNGGGFLLPKPFIDESRSIPVQEIVTRNKDWFKTFEALLDEHTYKQESEKMLIAAQKMTDKCTQFYETFRDFLKDIAL